MKFRWQLSAVISMPIRSLNVKLNPDAVYDDTRQMKRVNFAVSSFTSSFVSVVRTKRFGCFTPLHRRSGIPHQINSLIQLSANSNLFLVCRVDAQCELMHMTLHLNGYDWQSLADTE